MSATPEDIKKYELEFVQDIQSVETLIGTMAGYFSLCWEQPFSPSSEFLSERASAAVSVMLDRMEELVKKRISDEFHLDEQYVQGFRLYTGASDDRN